MYPNDSRYPDSMANMDSMSSIYGNQMRTSSIEMGSSRPYYEAPSYYDKMAPIIQQPMYDYSMGQPPMMPMNQGIDPRYPVWRQSSQNRASMMPSYYDRPPEPYMHPKAPVSMPYSDQYSSNINPVTQIRSSQMNLLQRISYLIKPQLSDLKKTMSKAATSSIIYKKKQHSRRQRSQERERPRQRSRSHERKKPSNSSGGQWVCSKCSFLNFDWREKCKKCSESKPSFPVASSGGGRNFIPGPEDWKCYKCGNLNYARRVQCNRCKLPKSANK